LVSGWHTHAHARAYTYTHTHTHIHTHTQKKCKSDQATSTWYTLCNANAGGAVTCKPYNSKNNEKIFYYSILKSSRGKLQEYVSKNGGFHLKNSK